MKMYPCHKFYAMLSSRSNFVSGAAHFICNGEGNSICMLRAMKTFAQVVKC